MRIIVGLGNPGTRYRDTRHNVGFMAVDYLATAWGLRFKRSLRHRGELAEGSGNGQRVVLLKPQTFMNLSGPSVESVLHFYKVTAADLLVVYDDLDLPPGKLRLRAKGSAGGHNGMKSIIAALGTSEFARLKVGIGRPPTPMDPADYVLQAFSTEEKSSIVRVIRSAMDEIATGLTLPLEQLMNRINGPEVNPV